MSAPRAPPQMARSPAPTLPLLELRGDAVAHDALLARREALAFGRSGVSIMWPLATSTFLKRGSDFLSPPIFFSSALRRCSSTFFTAATASGRKPRFSKRWIWSSIELTLK